MKPGKSQRKRPREGRRRGETEEGRARGGLTGQHVMTKRGRGRGGLRKERKGWKSMALRRII